MKKPFISLFLLFFFYNGASALDSQITSECPSGYEPVISLSDPDKRYSHPGPPSMYSDKLCVEGIKEAKVANNCGSGAGFYLSSNNSDSHFSSFESFNVPVCTGRMVTAVRETCNEGEIQLVSVSGDSNGHVAAKDVLDKALCGFYQPPKNVSVKLEFNLTSSDKVYFDGQKVEEDTFRIAEFPYMISVGNGYTAGLVASSFVKAERKLNRKNVLSLTRDSSNPTFLLPFTSGDQSVVQDRKDQVLGNDFLNSLSPNFGFSLPTEPEVKALIDSEINLTSNLEISQGTHQIKVKKIGENTVKISAR